MNKYVIGNELMIEKKKKGMKNKWMNEQNIVKRKERKNMVRRRNKKTKENGK